jgi:hypothetical protein
LNYPRTPGEGKQKLQGGGLPVHRCEHGGKICFARNIGPKRERTVIVAAQFGRFEVVGQG